MSDSAREAAEREYPTREDNPALSSAPLKRYAYKRGYAAGYNAAKAEAPKSHASAPWPLLTGDAEADEDAITSFVKHVCAAGAKGQPVANADIADFRDKLTLASAEIDDAMVATAVGSRSVVMGDAELSTPEAYALHCKGMRAALEAALQTKERKS